MTIVSWLFVRCKNDPCFKCHLHGRLIWFYLGDELRYMNLDGQDDPYTFQQSMWLIYLQNEGGPPYRLNLDFCCLGMICWSFRIIPPNFGLWQEPLWKLLWPRMSLWMRISRPCMRMSLKTWCHPAIAPQQKKWLAETLELCKSFILIWVLVVNIPTSLSLSLVHAQVQDFDEEIPK